MIKKDNHDNDNRDNSKNGWGEFAGLIMGVGSIWVMGILASIATGRTSVEVILTLIPYAILFLTLLTFGMLGGCIYFFFERKMKICFCLALLFFFLIIALVVLMVWLTPVDDEANAAVDVPIEQTIIIDFWGEYLI